MIPSKYAEELKNAPDDKADFIESFVEVCKPPNAYERFHCQPLAHRCSKATIQLLADDGTYILE